MSRWRLRWPSAGVLFAYIGLLSYFYVIVRHWPDGRDRGWAGVGMTTLAGLWALFGRRADGSRLHWVARLSGALPGVFMILYVFVWTYGLPAAPSSPDIGDRVPAFRLPGVDARESGLEDSRARWRVLLFFRGHW